MIMPQIAASIQGIVEELKIFAERCDELSDVEAEKRQHLAFALGQDVKVVQALDSIKKACQSLHQDCSRYTDIIKDVHFSLAGGAERV